MLSYNNNRSLPPLVGVVIERLIGWQLYKNAKRFEKFKKGNFDCKIFSQRTPAPILELTRVLEHGSMPRTGWLEAAWYQFPSAHLPRACLASPLLPRHSASLTLQQIVLSERQPASLV